MFRCPECRTRRKDYKLFLQHIQLSGHKLCDCGGYNYKHRPGSRYCYVNPMAPAEHASRAGMSDKDVQDIREQIAWEHPGKPFKRWI